jgi:hypothetical protein
MDRDYEGTGRQPRAAEIGGPPPVADGDRLTSAVCDNCGEARPLFSTRDGRFCDATCAAAFDME